MTSCTRHLSVSADERVARAVVIDPMHHRIREGSLIVTVGAVRSEAPGVGVLVAGGAAGTKAEVGAPSMAVRTGAGRVGALEGPAGLSMIESSAIPAGPSDLSRRTAEVLDVALPAGPPAVGAAVQTLARADSRGQRRVTAEASLRADAPAGRVAFVASRVALEPGVRTRERSGREELGTNRGR